MNFEQIEAFTTLIETGSFHAAAARLGISQPTVSQRLQRLESTLSCNLLERARDGCRPTPAAEAFLPHARALLQLRDRAARSVAKESIVVGASSNIGCYLLAPVLRPWVTSTSVETQVTIEANPELYTRLKAGLLDLALAEWWTEQEELCAFLWRREQLVLIVPPGHPFAELSTVPMERLAEQSFLGGEAGTGTGTLLKQAFGKLAGSLQVRQNLGSTQAVKAGVMAGWGISIVFRSAVEEELRAGTLIARPISGCTLEKKLYVAWKKELSAGSPAMRLVEYLRQDAEAAFANRAAC